jgi:hypothetical protein
LTLYVLEKNAPRFQKIEASASSDVASETRASSESDVRAGVQSPKGTKDESREDVLSDASDAAEATS